MSTVTVPSMIDRALAIRQEVMEAGWPLSREARWAIGWQAGELDDLLVMRGALLAGDLDPHAVRAPDMGWWDDPERQALEYVDDQALQAAVALRKRLAEGLRRKNAGKGERAA